MEFAYAHPAAAWLVLAIVCALVEVALPFFTAIFATCGALVASAVALRFDPNAQGIAFALATVASLISVRPLLTRRSRDRVMSRTDALIGRTGVVTVALAPEGRVSVGDEDWSARATRTVAQGKTIQITGADGIVLLVKEH